MIGISDSPPLGVAIMNITRHRLALAVSNRRVKAVDRRTNCLAQAYACADMALRADDAEDKKALGGMTTVWFILAQRDPPARAERVDGESSSAFRRD
jgi:hypothetical protein